MRAFPDYRDSGAQIVKRFTADDEYTRHSEGAFARLKDGRIYYAYSRFTGGHHDDSPSDIAACVSADEGLTWSEPETVLYARDFGTNNIMSVSLIRRLDGSLGLFFGARKEDGIETYLAVSRDEGKTFSEFLSCNLKDRPGYYVLNNDRVIRLTSGRLLMPLSFHRGNYDSERKSEIYWESKGIVLFRYSDDDGKTWFESPDKVFPPFMNTSGGLQETGVIEKENGDLLGYARTDQQVQYIFYSFDGGLHWTPAMPSEFTSPNSPLQMKRCPDDGSILAVWNPIPNYNGRKIYRGMHGRTPIVCARSTDDALSFSAPLFLAGEEDCGYCYPAVFFTNDGHVLISFCCGTPHRQECLADSAIYRMEYPPKEEEGKLTDGMRAPFRYQ